MPDHGLPSNGAAKPARPQTVIAYLALLAVAPFPTGSYGMPELCEKLKAATGVAHTVDASLLDMPVFVSAKSGEPERVRELVAMAMRAEWKKEPDRFVLSPVKMDEEAEFAKFEAKYKMACTAKPAMLRLPLRDLYRMAPGQILRYGYPATDVHKAFPKELQEKLKVAKGGPWYFLIRRMSEGVFESKAMLPDFSSSAFQDTGGVEFRDLPTDVEKLLKDDLKKEPFTPAELQERLEMFNDPAKLKIDWTNPSKRDPNAVLADVMLPKLGAAVSTDMAIALPDFSFYALGPHPERANTVRSMLSAWPLAVDLEVVEGAVIGKLPTCDRFAPAQVKRTVLGRFVNDVKTNGVANIAVLSEYVRNQRPAASNSWADGSFLALAGLVLDTEYLGDYPFNIRLYTNFSQGDWTLFRSGQPVRASLLSPQARAALPDLLLQPRSRLEDEKADPGLWKSRELNNLMVTPQVVEETVLIGWTGLTADVDLVSSAAMNFDRSRKQLGRDPLYQAAKRRKLKLIIASIVDKESIETGFTEILPDPSHKAGRWENLPRDLAAEFKKQLEEYRLHEKNMRPGVPPP